MIEGPGIVEDATFYDSDRDVARAGTGYDKERDAKAWQDKDNDKGTRNPRYQR
jgi:hypothetical protein